LPVVRCLLQNKITNGLFFVATVNQAGTTDNGQLTTDDGQLTTDSLSTYSSSLRSLSALLITDTELNVIAAAASMGLSSSPKTG